MLRSCLLILALTVTAAAQDIQVTGGGSTLFEASGAQVKAIFATSATSLSGGVSDGHVYAGLLETTKFHGLNVSAGDLNLPFVLATDFTSTPSFPAVGLTVSQKDSTREWTAFIGATADSYSTPFFFGSKTSAATAAFFGTERLTETLSFNSAEVFSNRQTAIETLVWHPFTPLTFAIAGGIGSNNLFGAGRVGWKTQHWVGVLNYTRHGASFQRITLPYGTITENSGLNASGAFNSTHFHASVDHTSYDNFVNSTLIESTVNSASASTSLSVFSANASSFFGTSAGLPVSGQTQGAGFAAGFITAHVDRYQSAGSRSTSASLTEKFSRRFSVNQFIQAHTVNAGGEYHSNTLTVSGGYSMSFFPVLDRFEKVLSAQVTIQLPNGFKITGGTVSTPDGRTRWTAYGNKYARGPLSDAELGHEAPVSGKFSFTGTAVDADGKPVAGVAITIGKGEVFTDSHGRFLMPSRKKKSQPLAVVPADFMAAGKWNVVSAPSTIAPEVPVTVVVARIVR